MGSQGKWLQLHKPTTRKPLWTRLASQHLCARPSWPGRFSWVLGRGEAEGMSSRCSARPTAAFPMASSVAQRHVGAGGPMPAGQWVVQSTPALCPFYTGPHCIFTSESKEDYGERDPQISLLQSIKGCSVPQGWPFQSEICKVRTWAERVRPASMAQALFKPTRTLDFSSPVGRWSPSRLCTSV